VSVDWRRVRGIARLVWVAGGLLFTAWLVWSFQAHGVPQAIFETDATVRVTHASGSWRFIPAGASKAAGLVFLPGGMVDPRAYGPIARQVAEAGYATVLVELPLRVAPTTADEQTVADRAREATGALGGRLSWVLAGHSRGAAIATRLIAKMPAAYEGLVLVGTTHPRVDLSRLTIPVFKIGGTADCVAPRAESERAAVNLPRGTEWRWIEGANHAQFGFYGRQLLDCRPSISREAQQRALLAILTEALERIARG
jgi:pimeloyl-ACP methyl ester carboxylesterase